MCVCVCAEHSNTSDLLCSFAYLIGKLEDCITCEAIASPMGSALSSSLIKINILDKAAEGVGDKRYRLSVV